MATTTNKELIISPQTTICAESILTGPIHVGSKTVVHPRASIHAEAGPIIIGESNIFEEQSVVRNVNSGVEEAITLKIGSNNVFEVGATVLAKAVGNNNVFESKCYVGPDMVVGNGCTVGAGVTLTVPETLSDNIVIYGSNCDRRIAPNKPMPQTSQLDFLSKVLPNYHYIRKATGSKEHK